MPTLKLRRCPALRVPGAAPITQTRSGSAGCTVLIARRTERREGARPRPAGRPRSAGRIDQGLRISGSLWRFWHLRAHLQEGSQLLDDLLSAPLGQTDPAARASGLAAVGSLAYWQLDYRTAQQGYAQALSCFQQAGDAAGIAEAHYNLGFTTQFAGDSHKARGLFEAAAREYDNLGDELGRLNALTGIALVDHMTGNTERARQQVQASLQRFRALGDHFAASNCLSLLGSILRAQGNLSEASTILREALAAHDQAGNLSGIVWMLHELAGIAFTRNQTERALRLSGAASRMQGQGGTVPVEQLPLARLKEAIQALTAVVRRKIQR